MTALDHHPDRPEFWDGKGCAHCEAEEFADAVAAFDRAIALDANYCRAWNNRANALCGQKKYAERRWQPMTEPLRFSPLITKPGLIGGCCWLK